MEARKLGSGDEGEEVDIVDVVGWFLIVVDCIVFGCWIERVDCGMGGYGI